jgi:threonine dehydratase
MIVGLAEIEAARRRIAGAVRLTPVEPSASLTARTGVPVWLKCEHHQHTGSFKLRGATNAVAQLSEDERARGVVAASTGNHGRALAHAAAAAGARAVICMSRLVPANKVSAIESLGAEVRIVGRSQDDAQVEVERLVAEEGLAMIPPFDDPRVVAGQGTLGLEMLEAVPELECVLVQLSGGGLIAGIAAALKARVPGVRVVGVSMARGAAMAASLEAGHPVQVEELATLADSLGGGIGLANRVTFPMVRELVDEVVLLSEPEIAAGVRHSYWEERQVVEGAGGAGVAALLAGKVAPRGPTMLLLSGANIDMGLHHRIASGEDVDLLAEEEADEPAQTAVHGAGRTGS